MEKAVPFWEDLYRADDVMAFTVEPNKTVVEYERLLDKSANILEAGCGEGQNVLYLAKYVFEKKYDLIMSFAALCFAEKDAWRKFIVNAKDNTNVGGIHIIHIFTDEVPASADIAPFAVGLAHDGELKELYNDCEILNFQSYVFEDEHPGVPKHMHSVNKIVARKSYLGH